MLSILQCLVFCLSYSSAVFFPVVHHRFFWYTIVIFHYASNVAYFSLFKSDITFSNLFRDLEIVDQGLNVDPVLFNLDVSVMILLATLFSVLYRLIAIYTYCTVTGACILSFWNRILLISMLESADFVLITYTSVFYSVHCRLRKLISTLDITNSNIVSLHRIYKLLVDVADKHKAAFDLIFLIALIANVPEAMSAIYFSVTELLREKTKKQSLELCADYATVTAALSLTFAPALCAGMLTSQANKLKVVLYNELIIERDAVRIRQIERFIRYVGARGCRFVVFKVIPLDANLIGMVLGFCVTYLIVIIQFTH